MKYDFQFYFSNKLRFSYSHISWAPKSLWTVTAAMKIKMFAPWKNSYDKSRWHIKKQRHNFADQGPSSQRLIFFSSYIKM